MLKTSRCGAPYVLLALLVLASCHRSGYPDQWRFSLLEHLDEATFEPQPGWTPITNAARIGETERPAILMHTPMVVRFPVQVPAGTRLSFGFGIQTIATDSLPQASGSPGATFLVAVSRAGARRVLWTQTLRAPDARWRDINIDIPAGSDTVSLEVDGNGMAARQAVWSLPVLRSATPAPASPAQRFGLVRNLLKGTAPPINPDSFVGYGGVLPMDLSTRAERSLPANAAEQRFAVDLVPGAFLELGAEVLRGLTDPGTAPVRFTAELDGAPVAQHEVDPRAAPLQLSWRIPIHADRPKQATLVLKVEGNTPHTIAWWTLACLRNTQEAPRKLSTDGANILVLLVDTLRADHLGLYGSRRPTSPVLDAFAKQGLVFDNAISAAPWTEPSIATLFTGLDPQRHGVIGGTPLSPEPETFAEVLAGRGLTTMAVSANPIIGWREGFSRGFETFVHLPWARAATVNAEFLDWVQSHHNDRWAVYLHYIDPHDPYAAPPPFAGLYTRSQPGKVDARPEELHKWDFGYSRIEVTRENAEWLSAAYDEEIRYWDSCLQTLLNGLKEGGLSRRTIVIVLGDHGEEFLDHGRLFHETQLYRESVHVPLVVVGPGVAAGRRQDLFSTNHVKDLLLGLAAGAPLQSSLRGGPAYSHTALAFPRGGGHYETLASVRDMEWTCIQRPADGRLELYDLRQDPQEHTNIAASQPERSSACAAKLKQWLSQPGPAAPRWDDPGMIEKLRSLGYIQ